MLKSISFTKLFTFNTCQRKYRYIYVERIKRPPGSKLVFGISSHETQEYAYGEQIEGGKRPSLSKQKDYFASSLDAELDRGIEWDEGDNRDRIQKDGLEVVESYDKNIAPSVKPIEVEKPFEIEFDNVGWKLIGRMDIVEKDKISDMKFGRAKINPEDPKVQVQLGMYKYADKLMNPKGKDKKVGIHSVRRLIRKKPAEVIDVKQSVKENDVLENIAETAKAIELAEKAGNFPKVYNQSVCSWCNYRDLCGL